jgi:hypothetical protein
MDVESDIKETSLLPNLQEPEQRLWAWACPVP